MVPHLYHTITVTKRTGQKSRVEKEKAFRFSEDTDGQLERAGRGEDWWNTYRHQLEAFVDKVKSREPRTWHSKADSVAEAEWLVKIYEAVRLGYLSLTNGAHMQFFKMGLEVRPPSSHYLERK